MQWRMVVNILLVQHFLEEQLSLGFEVADDLVVVLRGDELLEFVQDVHTAPRVIRVLGILEVLDLHEEVEELIETFNDIDVNLEKSFERFMAFSEFIHGDVVNGVSPQNTVLLRQDLSVACDDVARVLLEERNETQVELAVPFDRVCVVLHRFDELALLDVHSLHSETVFLLLQLVVHDFLETHALEAEQAHQAVVVALIRQDVVSVQPAVVDVKLVEDHVTGRAHLQRQVHCNVLEPKMTNRSREETKDKVKHQSFAIKGGRWPSSWGSVSSCDQLTYQAISIGERPSWSRCVISART